MGLMSAQTSRWWKGEQFLEKPADPIILGTSPMNYRADTFTFFSFSVPELCLYVSRLVSAIQI